MGSFVPGLRYGKASCCRPAVGSFEERPRYLAGSIPRSPSPLHATSQGFHDDLVSGLSSFVFLGSDMSGCMVVANDVHLGSHDVVVLAL